MAQLTAKAIVEDACLKLIDRAGSRRQLQPVRDAAQVRACCPCPPPLQGLIAAALGSGDEQLASPLYSQASAGVGTVRKRCRLCTTG